MGPGDQTWVLPCVVYGLTTSPVSNVRDHYEDRKSPPDLLTLTISAELMGRKCGHFGVCLSNYKRL